MKTVVSQINVALRSSEITTIQKKAYTYNSLPDLIDSDSKVRNMLNLICRDLDKDLIVFFDEADCMSNSSLITFLSQVRDGYLDRSDQPSTKFPRSLALVGMRNIRDYKSQIRPDEKSTGTASPFNIITETFSLANFTKDEIRTLYNQHAEATGQVFEPSAIDAAWNWSEGQPWLVNALAREVVYKQLNNDFSIKVTGDHFNQATRSLILRNETHFDSLRERLKEPRVRRVIEAVVIGASKFPKGISDDDISYTIDLGLLKTDPIKSKVFLPANPIYQEIIVRTFTTDIDLDIRDEEIISFRNKWMDGKNLDMSGLLRAFQDFWAKNAEMYIKNNKYDGMILNSSPTPGESAAF
jgi:hypothetical protein